MWRKDGRELFFVSNDGALMAAGVNTSQTSVEFGPPSRLFMQKDLSGYAAVPGNGGRPSYAPSADGQRFLVLVPIDDERVEGLHLVRNWKP